MSGHKVETGEWMATLPLPVRHGEPAKGSRGAHRPAVRFHALELVAHDTGRDCNTTADHITTAQLALAQLPKRYGRGRNTLIRTDSAGGPTNSWPGSPGGAGGCRTRSA